MRIHAVIPSLLIAVPATAHAGSLRTFNREVVREPTAEEAARQKQQNTEPSEDSCEDAADPAACRDEESQMYAAIFRLMMGHLPGDQFSWGRSPFEGRGPVQTEVASLSLEAPAPEPRSIHVIAAAGAVSLLEETGGGLSLQFKAESTYTPALVIGYTGLGTPRGDRLGHVELALEPRLYTGETVTWFYRLGWAGFSDDAGDRVDGMAAGIGTTLYPTRHVMAELRLQGALTTVQWVPDLRATVGYELSEGLFVTAGLRSLGPSGVSVPTMVAGLTWDAGF